MLSHVMWLALVFSGDLPRAPVDSQELARLQGRWLMTSFEGRTENGERVQGTAPIVLEIRGNTWTIDDKDNSEILFLESKSVPKRLTLKVVGTERAGGLGWVLYKLEDKTLTICTRKAGLPPLNFDISRRPGAVLAAFHRIGKGDFDPLRGEGPPGLETETKSDAPKLETRPPGPGEGENAVAISPVAERSAPAGGPGGGPGQAGAPPAAGSRRFAALGFWDKLALASVSADDGFEYLAGRTSDDHRPTIYARVASTGKELVVAARGCRQAFPVNRFADAITKYQEVLQADLRGAVAEKPALNSDQRSVLDRLSKLDAIRYFTGEYGPQSPHHHPAMFATDSEESPTGSSERRSLFVSAAADSHRFSLERLDQAVARYRDCLRNSFAVSDEELGAANPVARPTQPETPAPGAGPAPIARATEIDATDPRARPLVHLLQAVADSDQDLFRSAFSAKAKDAVERANGGWEEALKAFRASLHKDLGNFGSDNVSAMRFLFSGAGGSGVITVLSSDGKHQAPHALVKEGAVWKIERPVAEDAGTIGAVSTQRVAANDPHARPLVHVLQAVADSDLDLFRSAFSRKIKENTRDEDWAKALGAYRRQFHEQLGEYRADDVAGMQFELSSDGQTDRIGVVNRQSKVDGALRVVKEGLSWKIDER